MSIKPLFAHYTPPTAKGKAALIEYQAKLKTMTDDQLSIEYANDMRVIEKMAFDLTEERHHRTDRGGAWQMRAERAMRYRKAKARVIAQEIAARQEWAKAFRTEAWRARHREHRERL